jgi:hypothetical protein
MVGFFSVPFWWYQEVNSCTTARRIFTATFEGTEILLDADIGKAPSKKSGCDIAPVCQSCAYINPPFRWTASVTARRVSRTHAGKRRHDDPVGQP